MIFRSLILAILTISISFGSAWAGSDDSILTGNETSLFHISFETATSDETEGESGAATFSVTAKLIDSPWEWVAENIRGQVATATAVGENLHIIFQGGPHQIFPIRGNGSKPGAKLDSAPLTTCQGPAGFAGAAAPSLLAMTRQANGETEPPLILWQYTSGKWRKFTQFDQSNIPPGTQVLSAAMGQDYYLLVWHPDNSTGDVHKFSNHKWTKIGIKPDLDRVEVFGFFALGGHVTALLSIREPNYQSADPASETISLTMANLAVSSERWTYQSIATDDKPASWAADKKPVAGRLGPDRIALIWTDDKGNLVESSVGLDGQLLPAGQFTLPITSMEEAESLLIMSYFMWGVFIVSMAAMLLLRPQELPQPFILDESIRVGSLIRRAFAGGVDFFPFLLLSSLIFAPKDVIVTSENFKQVFDELSRQKESALAFITAVTLYTTYSFLMELHYGATLGKRFMKLRVVANNAQPANFRAILLRNLIRLIEMNWLILPFIMVMVLMGRYHQRLGDIVGRTAVVDARTLNRANTLANTDQQTDPQSDIAEADDPPDEKPNR